MRLLLTAAGCAATTALLASAAHCAEPLARGAPLYWGATLGAVVVKPDDHKVDSKQDHDMQASGGLLLGLLLGKLPVSEGWPVHLELGYQDIASHTIRYKVQNSFSDLTVRGHAATLTARMGIPLTSHFGLYTKLGVARSRVTGSTPANQPAVAVTGSGTGLVHAVGLEYQFDSGPNLRGEVAAIGKTSSKSIAGAFNLGLVFRF